MPRPALTVFDATAVRHDRPGPFLADSLRAEFGIVRSAWPRVSGHRACADRLDALIVSRGYDTRLQ